MLCWSWSNLPTAVIMALKNTPTVTWTKKKCVCVFYGKMCVFYGNELPSIVNASVFMQCSLIFTHASYTIWQWSWLQNTATSSETSPDRWRNKLMRLRRASGNSDEEMRREQRCTDQIQSAREVNLKGANWKSGCFFLFFLQGWRFSEKSISLKTDQGHTE